MKIAILISGHCRTFVYQEQRIFFERFIKSIKKKQKFSELKKVSKQTKKFFEI
jgi:hypothetical protein